MKFVSKIPNYCVVLRPGIPPEKATGRNAIPGLSVRFEHGIAIVNNEETCEMLMRDSRFNVDYILVKEGEIEPNLSYRESEPRHKILEMQGGVISHSVVAPSPLKLSDEQKAIFNEMVKDTAMKIAKEIAPGIAKEMLKEMISQKKIETRGRKPKNKEVEDKIEQPEEKLTTG